MEEMKTFFVCVCVCTDMCTTVFYIALNVVQRWKREERDWYYTEQSVSLREVQGSNLRNAIEETETER